MAANTGRTADKWTDFYIDDSAGTLRLVKHKTISGLGLMYPARDTSAVNDATDNSLPGRPALTITVVFPLDTTALTGSYTVLNGIAGGVTPLTMDVRVGVRHAWEAGEPQFGITSDASNGMLCQSMEVNPDAMEITGVFVVYPGSSSPAWGVAAET